MRYKRMYYDGNFDCILGIQYRNRPGDKKCRRSIPADYVVRRFDLCAISVHYTRQWRKKTSRKFKNKSDKLRRAFDSFDVHTILPLHQQIPVLVAPVAFNRGYTVEKTAGA